MPRLDYFDEQEREARQQQFEILLRRNERRIEMNEGEAELVDAHNKSPLSQSNTNTPVH